MKRFFGLMPSNEIEITKTFKDDNGYEITIDAGKHGWTIIYADTATEYEDIDGTAEENFNRAYKILKSHFDKLEEVNENAEE